MPDVDVGTWLFKDNTEQCVVDFDTQRWRYLEPGDDPAAITVWRGPSGKVITTQAMLNAGWKLVRRLDFPVELQLSEGL